MRRLFFCAGMGYKIWPWYLVLGGDPMMCPGFDTRGYPVGFLRAW